MEKKPYDELVRMRPGMYIGAIDGDCLGRLFTEVIAFNLMAELGGAASTIIAELGPGNTVKVIHLLDRLRGACRSSPPSSRVIC